MTHIAAERRLASRPSALYAFLADLRRHWELLPDAVEVDAPRRSGAIIRLRGPLGIRRTLRTEVTEARPVTRFAGRATARSTSALVTWSLCPEGSATRVRLSVEVERASLRDRLVLALGGGAWLQRRLALALERLDAALAPAEVSEAA